MLHHISELIIEQYRIIDFLGEGLGGLTYKALDLKSDNYVALKVLSLRQMNNWKTIELFEREASILAQLKHPRIPDYLNYFQIDNTQEKRWYLVQEFISGQPLSTLVDDGWRTTEAEVINIAAQILETLVYLHNLQPPVIHRDIKPQNIIRQPNGKIYLVDFGAVSDIYRQTLIGSSTVVGTYGYMPPEQFRGQVVFSSDLYSLGATILHLLTHSSPAEFPQKKLKIDFRSSVNVSKELTDWLEIMLEPAIEDRFESASQALAVLRGDTRINNWRNSHLRKPPHSKITVAKTKDRINFVIPHNKGESGDLNNRLIIFYILLFIVALVFSPGTVSSELSFTNDLTVRAILAIPFAVSLLYFLFNYLFSSFGCTQIEIKQQNFDITYSLFGLKRQIYGETKDITEAKIGYRFLSGYSYNNIKYASSVVARCFIVEGTKTKQFARYTKRVNEINKSYFVLIEFSQFIRKYRVTIFFFQFFNKILCQD